MLSNIVRNESVSNDSSCQFSFNQKNNDEQSQYVDRQQILMDVSKINLSKDQLLSEVLDGTGISGRQI
jgi:hypothetical protein